jgi:hypothetical protein
MSVTRDAAAEALRLADEAGQRSALLRGYQSAAPHLILWGGVYAVAYTFGYFRPHQAGLAWAVLVPAATIGDALIARRDRGNINWGRFLGLFATFLAFISATVSVMQPHNPRQMAAFVPLVVATAYIVLGIGVGRRLVFTGIALGVLTLVGFFALSSIFMLWMAVVGGGALVFGGLWLRQT